MKIKYPGRMIHIVGISIAGIWFFSTIINSLWPENIKYNPSNFKRDIEIRRDYYQR